MGETRVPRDCEPTADRSGGGLWKIIHVDNGPRIQTWIRDLTEYKLMEKRLIESQKMEAAGTLTGGIAHDFNNLLTIINGFTEIILATKTEKNPDYLDLRKILETGRKAPDASRN